MDLFQNWHSVFVSLIFQHFYLICIAFILYQLNWIHIKLSSFWYFFCLSIIPGLNQAVVYSYTGQGIVQIANQTKVWLFLYWRIQWPQTLTHFRRRSEGWIEKEGRLWWELMRSWGSPIPSYQLNWENSRLSAWHSCSLWMLRTSCYCDCDFAGRHIDNCTWCKGGGAPHVCFPHGQREKPAYDPPRPLHAWR